MKTTFFTLLALPTVALAHGWIHGVKCSSGTYTGNAPTQLAQNQHIASPIRQIADNNPVKDLTSADLTCGRQATPASQIIDAKAGETLEVTWMTATGNGLWFHNVGPMMAYLADCGDEGCDKFDASKAKWFKILEQGKDSDGNWVQASLDTGSPAFVPLPANIKPGNYLLRHEIVALHTAQTLGNAEFYPNCAQLRISGSGSAVPKASELVSLPGAYKPQDKGVLIDVYDMTGPYVFPGPPVASFVSGGSSGGVSQPSAPSSGSSTSGSSSSGTGSGTPANAGSNPNANKGSSSSPASPSSTGKASTSSSSSSTGKSSNSSSSSSSSGSKTCKKKNSERRRALSKRAIAGIVDEVVVREAPAPVIREEVSVPVMREEKPDIRRSRMHMHRQFAGHRRGSF